LWSLDTEKAYTDRKAKYLWSTILYVESKPSSLYDDEETQINTMTSDGQSYSEKITAPITHSDSNQNVNEKPEKPKQSRRLFRNTKKQRATTTDLNNASSQQAPPSIGRNPNTSSSAGVINSTYETLPEAQHNRLDGDTLGRSLNHPTGGEKSAGNGSLDVQLQALLAKNQKLELGVKAMNTDLCDLTQQLSTAKQDLESERRKKGSQEDLRPQIERLQRELQTLRDKQGKTESRLKAKEDEVEVLRPNEKFWQGQAKTLEENLGLTQRDLRFSQEKVKELTDTITEWKESYDSIQEQFQRAGDELNQVKSELRTVRDDEFFRERWHRLQADVEQWAEDHFGGKLKSQPLPNEPAKEPSLPADLAALCRDCRDILNEDSTRHWIVQAFVWSFIEENIFDSRPDSHLRGIVWAPKRVRTEFCRLEEFLRPGIFSPQPFGTYLPACSSSSCTDLQVSDEERRKFLKWKANTANMIISRNQRDHQNPGAATNEITSRYQVHSDKMRIHFRRDELQWYIDVLLHVTRAWLTSDDEPKCREDMIFIIRLAIEFDAYMHEQWAHFFTVANPTHVMTKKRHEFPFEGNFMVCASPDHQMQRPDQVGLVVSPALVRSGTLNGDNYSSEQVVLAKSRVLPYGFKPPNRQGGAKVKDASQKRNVWGFSM